MTEQGSFSSATKSVTCLLGVFVVRDKRANDERRHRPSPEWTRVYCHEAVCACRGTEMVTKLRGLEGNLQHDFGAGGSQPSWQDECKKERRADRASDDNPGRHCEGQSFPNPFSSLMRQQCNRAVTSSYNWQEYGRKSTKCITLYARARLSCQRQSIYVGFEVAIMICSSHMARARASLPNSGRLPISQTSVATIIILSSKSSPHDLFPHVSHATKAQVSCPDQCGCQTAICIADCLCFQLL